MYDEPDDDGSERFLEAGWWTSEDVEEVVDLLNLVDIGPRPGSRTDAVLILLLEKVGKLPHDDPHVVWARQLLGKPTVAQQRALMT